MLHLFCWSIINIIFSYNIDYKLNEDVDFTTTQHKFSSEIHSFSFIIINSENCTTGGSNFRNNKISR